ncbi:transcriptional regulator [Pseudomonas sp. BAY1663]|uniref:TetR family transcriptional regulator n=1 Tax=Stutzerimonas stutzeri TaxID=316 RepID=A0A2N8T3W2_STUST|nr:MULTISPECIES: TetR/AcrR family transcriptional regulator [Pseudomonadaceae]EXF42753.1 transcriptional regulator [Pseudomonas sp. BAY1663]MCQ4326994.1 TetR/AcrR family transcriptional regulator [Stutzerimonas stutzeri]PNG09447.1 TetR family transcriptional regulator [Stutzerimonas stutzeri]
MNRPARNDKRELILTRGAQVMTRRGYHGTGVQEIVQAAGIPKGSFYHYFASKEDFALQALAYIYEPRLERYRAALANSASGPRQRILDYYAELVAHFARQERPEYHCFIGSLSFEMAELSQPIGRQVCAILARSVELLAACLDQARNAGEIASGCDCPALAEFIGDAWEGALLRMKVGGDAAPLQVFLEQLERLLAPAASSSPGCDARLPCPMP